MSNATTGKIVRFTLDPANPPALSEEAKARLSALTGEAIDYSDIPRSPPDAEWTRPGMPLSIENKAQVTLRLDRDVLDYFRHTGKRYQTRINNVLRAYMRAQK